MKTFDTYLRSTVLEPGLRSSSSAFRVNTRPYPYPCPLCTGSTRRGVIALSYENAPTTYSRIRTFRVASRPSILAFALKYAREAIVDYTRVLVELIELVEDGAATVADRFAYASRIPQSALSTDLRFHRRMRSDEAVREAAAWRRMPDATGFDVRLRPTLPVSRWQKNLRWLRLSRYVRMYKWLRTRL